MVLSKDFVLHKLNLFSIKFRLSKLWFGLKSTSWIYGFGQLMVWSKEFVLRKLNLCHNCKELFLRKLNLWFCATYGLVQRVLFVQVESLPQLQRLTIVTILTYRVPSLQIIPIFLFFVFLGLQHVFPWHSPSQLVTVIFFLDLQLFSSIKVLCFALRQVGAFSQYLPS